MPVDHRPLGVVKNVAGKRNLPVFLRKLRETLDDVHQSTFAPTARTSAAHFAVSARM